MVSYCNWNWLLRKHKILQVFDVTKGSLFYGPDGAYSKLAGHDATRALAKMDFNLVKETPDDLSDMSDLDLDTANEWMQSFICKSHSYHRIIYICL